ncbi:hypothetical protein DOY81_008375 [Sarcophaga bullata]|nr:hypothetical protein DOY81_008375 [Sarcophaga bullata]
MHWLLNVYLAYFKKIKFFNENLIYFSVRRRPSFPCQCSKFCKLFKKQVCTCSHTPKARNIKQTAATNDDINYQPIQHAQVFCEKIQ